MSVLIIGSSGFIGSSLMNHFGSRGYDVAGADIASAQSADYRFFQVNGTADDWKRVFSSGSFEYCINAAGSSNVNDSLAYPDKDFSLNVKDTAAVLEGIRLGENRFCSYIHISSAAVYGNPVSLPVKETDACQPVSPYGWNKLMSEELCREYHSLYGIPVAIARPFSVYGCGLRKQLFWDIFLKWKKNPAFIELWGTGEETRDFIHIDDLTYSFECLIKSAPMKAEIYNMGNGEMITIKDAASFFIKMIDPNTLLSFNGKEHAGNPRKWQADIASMKSLGYQSSVKFEKGIKDLALWMRSEDKTNG